MSSCGLSHLIPGRSVGTLLGMEMAIARTVDSSTSALLPIMGAVFVAFLITGIAMPVLPLHVHQGLGLGTFIVGLIAGSQFAAALVSRVAAGRDADGRGAKHAVFVGLAFAATGGVLYLVSLAFVSAPSVSAAISPSAGLATASVTSRNAVYAPMARPPLSAGARCTASAPNPG